MGNAYEKIENNARNLLVPFASNGLQHFAQPIFEFNKSLKKLNFDADVLFLKDARREWYLGGLEGMGSNIDENLDFLKNEFAKYDKVICMGCSAGGYGALLYGSLLNVDAVIAFYPQCHLDFLTPDGCVDTRHSPTPICNERMRQYDSFRKYNNLADHLNDTTDYHVMTEKGSLFHGPYHYEILSHQSNVHKFDYGPGEALENGFVEKVVGSHINK
jgi:hypothetical protein